jgi:hypothetical protein
MNRIKISAALAVLFALVLSLDAAIIVQYNFNSNGSPTTVASNISGASTITNTQALNNFNVSTNPDSGYASNVFQVSPNVGGKPSSPNGSYFTFGFTVDPGYQLDLETLTLQGARGGGSTPRGVALSTSADSHAAFIDGTRDFDTVRPTLNSYSFDLSSLSTQTGTFIFRVYVYAPGTGNTIEIDDLTVNGTLSVIPEPSTWLLLACGIVTLSILRLRCAGATAKSE